MSQIRTTVREGKDIYKDIKKIGGNDIISDNIYFWKIIKNGEFDCFMIQNRTNDYYGVTDAIKLYIKDGEWYREICQCLRKITDDNHAKIYIRDKIIYTAVYEY
jgi:hypothetical protein